MRACVCVCVCVRACARVHLARSCASTVVDVYMLFFVKLQITFSISMHIMCDITFVQCFERVGALQISIIIII